MMCYLKEIRILKYQFKKVEILQISRGNNSRTDSLATLASSMVDPLSRIISIELLPFSSVTPSDGDLILSIHPSASWMDPLVAYLQNEILPEDKKKAEWIRHRSP